MLRDLFFTLQNWFRINYVIISASTVGLHPERGIRDSLSVEHSGLIVVRERERESPKRRFSQKTADFRRFTPSPGNSSIWSAQETAENRRFSQKTEDFRRKPQETADWAPSP